MINQPLSLEELSTFGEEFYLDKLKDVLEKDFMGQYAVIDVEQKKYQVDPDKMKAIKKAQQAFGQKLFYIVQIGNIRKPTNPFTKKYAWHF